MPWGVGNRGELSDAADPRYWRPDRLSVEATVLARPEKSSVMCDSPHSSPVGSRLS